MAKSPFKSVHGKPRGSSPLYAVIMAGGQGTRFWPVSRKARPKQFLALASERSLLRETAERLVSLVGWQRLLVVTQDRYRAAVREELPELPAAQVLAEPEGKNTLPCLVLAATWIDRREPAATMIAAPSDHRIAPAVTFHRELRAAARLARETQSLVTLGIVPTRPETGYGYIERGGAVEGVRGAEHAFWVARFREKPDARAAARFVRSGRFFWNSGVFVWTLPAFARAVRAFFPALWEQSRLLWDLGEAASTPTLRRLYQGSPAVSVDVGIFEPLTGKGKRSDLPRVAVVPARFRWSDLGSWQEVGELWPHDALGNAVRGNVLCLESEGSLAWSEGRLVALLGVRDLVVVETKDAVLVCSRNHAQAVREIVAELGRRGWRQWQ